MKVAIVYFEKKFNAKNHVFLKELQNNAKSRCDELVLLDGYKLQETDTFDLFDYTAVYIMEKGVFSTKPEAEVFTILKAHGIKTGKKGCALTPRTGLFSGRFVRNTMNELEDIGMRLDYFDTVKTEDDVRRAGNNIG